MAEELQKLICEKCQLVFHVVAGRSSGICPRCRSVVRPPPDLEHLRSCRLYIGSKKEIKQEIKEQFQGFAVIGIGLAVVCFFAWLFYGAWQHVLSVCIVGILFFVGLAIYFLPTFVAWKRSHKNRVAIFALNLLTGWSFVGWVIALVWALKND